MINRNLAVIIREQLIGQYSGHMAAIPFNPVLYSIFTTLMKDEQYDLDDKRLAIVLRKIADALEGQSK